MNILRLLILTTLIALLQVSNVRAQEVSYFQIWTDFNPTFTLNKNFMLKGDVGYRIKPSTTTQIFLIRGAVRYMPGKIFGMDAGLGSFNLWDSEYSNSTEFRIYEYLFLNWPSIWGFKFNLRLGFEQRWFRFHELLTNKFVHRSRLRIGVKSPEFKLIKDLFPFYGVMNAEWLRDLNDEDIGLLIDHNRFMIGLGAQVNEKLRTELQFQIMGLKEAQLSTVIREVTLLRARVFYKIK